MLRVFRKSAGLEQQYVARKLGLNNRTSLSEWESARRMPSGENLIKLCILYNTTPKEMYPEYYQYLTEFLTQIE